MTMHTAPAKARGIMAVRAEADATTILATLQNDWQAFQAAQAEKDKEINARFDDVVTTEKIDRINASIGELQAAIDASNAQLAAMEMGGSGSRSTPVDAEYTNAFSAHFKGGDVQASLNKGSDTDGGYLAPVEWDRTITNKLIEVSPMRGICSVMRVSGTTFKKLYNMRGTNSGWVGETANRTQTANAQFEEGAFPFGEIYAMPAATQTILDDAEINLESWLAGEVETEFAFQEGGAFIAGDGDNKPFGLLTYADGAANAGRHPLGAIPVKGFASATDVTSDELIDMIYAVPSSYTMGARFIMNRTSQGKIRKLKDGDGNYLWQPSAQAGQPASLHGYPVTEIPGMPDMTTGAMPIAFGNFQRSYLILDRAGVRVLRDPYTLKPYVLFYTTKRVGGGLLDPQGLVIAKQA
ncbi:phage major capsid protein [Roseibium sp. RKSG952]|uniref:phage major capsid protein n=1 Tax=Roseibium sp. RKSG952 TaxID=2529384 RepID=UPI0012BB970F|nr:phage major capsid protein [Roseibium sp. RKSG952]MTH96649.1 phage major capsid protein [Roseibium sp. RKSG952]